MVLLHFKNSEDKQFLFETTVSSTVAETTRALCDVHNLRCRIQRLKLEGEELAKYGPAKPMEQQGLDEYAEHSIEKGPNYTPDPTGRRTGNAPPPELRDMLLKTLAEAEAAASKDLVARKQILTRKALEEAVDNVRGAVMICYPMGLPPWDTMRLILEDTEELAGTSYANDPLDPETSLLWYCGKQMAADKALSDHVGKNEKTKVVIKATRKGQQAPAREPTVDGDTQKAMMAWYHKKQEEQKALAEDEADAYQGAAWADPKSLKSHFAGVGGNVRIR